MTAPSCPIRFRAWSGPDGTFTCRKPAGHWAEHDAAGLFPGQTITWYNGDRRIFTGEFTPCDQSSCLLPAGHHRSHAV